MSAGNADEIVGLIGLNAYHALVDARGGTYVFVPRSADSAVAARLENVVGPDALAKLVARFGGENIYVGNGKVVRSSRAQVLSMRGQAMTISEMALAAGCTEKTVRKHLRGS